MDQVVVLLLRLFLAQLAVSQGAAAPWETVEVSAEGRSSACCSCTGT